MDRYELFITNMHHCISDITSFAKKLKQYVNRREHLRNWLVIVEDHATISFRVAIGNLFVDCLIVNVHQRTITFTVHEEISGQVYAEIVKILSKFMSEFTQSRIAFLTCSDIRDRLKD